MARPLRIEFPGAIYHVISRGNASQIIYEDDVDRRNFLEILSSAIQRYHWLCHAYCLMGNHYHLLIETPEANLSSGMRQINGVYTRRFNARHQRSGHLFQGRFKAIIVERDPYLLELIRYISLNPVRAGMATDPAQYRWSSFAAMTGDSGSPSFLHRNWTLSQFSSDEAAAIRKYRQFVYDGMLQGNKIELEDQSVLGSARFKTELQSFFGNSTKLKEFPRKQRYAGRPALEDIFHDSASKQSRNAAIRECIMQYGYTLTEVGQHLNLHYSTISKIVNMKTDNSRPGTELGR